MIFLNHEGTKDTKVHEVYFVHPLCPLCLRGSHFRYLPYQKLHAMKQFFSALLLTVLASSFSTAQKAGSPRLNHIAFYVADLKTSTDFYLNVVGLDTIPEPFHDGRHTWFLIGPKSHLHVISGAPEKTTHIKNTHLCFTVPSVDEFIKRLNKYNTAYESWDGKKFSVTNRVDGVKQIYFQDPDGYWIEINDARE
jgi:lactoylglutathione lyase